ncbi:C40 family peptidase [Pseudothermotoga thermarum]|uniref:NLP/P60 protein n=1 Tax=Pseudothermotoga thermarum DSM 5069 TaxID=688269 RepID=F7YTT8_9THEM|nr:C40 family peptidase [Pseudothermotoga thermarum]AEH51383.1 NLP/P60 protein [Pseudothermotoga thermarum DSM 5069]
MKYKMLVIISLMILSTLYFGSDQKMESTKIGEVVENVKKTVELLRKEMKIDPRETVFVLNVKEESGKVVLEGKISDINVKEKILNEIQTRFLNVEIKVEQLPSKKLGEKICAVVAVPVLNLGEAPWKDQGKHVVTQARMGELLKLFDEKEGWYLVQMEDNYLGWVYGERIWICDEKELNKFLSNKFALITAKMTPAFASLDGVVAFDKQLVQGTLLPILEHDERWSKLLVPGGREIYVKSQDIKVFPTRDAAFSEKRDAQYIIEIAKQYLGLPYLWGGTTAYGFDCSGFTQFCFKMAGYFLRRDADMQFEQGIPIMDRKELKPGDLVFFQTYKPGPSHVGIYIGDMKYIHSGSNGVAINSFDPSAPDYSQSLDLRYIGARRILP